MSYPKAKKIVETLLDNMSPEKCTFGERYPEAYEYLKSFKADMIEDVKHELESRRRKVS